jgi:CCR4-NOT transcriptional regulation complex NOT5 subunit
MSVPQVEVNEAEIEVKLSTVKRNREPPQEARQLQQINVRHKRHIERLEQVQRALANEGIDVQHVDDIKDSLECYLVCFHSPV